MSSETAVTFTGGHFDQAVFAVCRLIIPHSLHVDYYYVHQKFSVHGQHKGHIVSGHKTPLQE